MTQVRTLDLSLLAVSLIGGALLVWLALVEAPDFEGRAGFTAPISWKLFFFHVPVAFVAFIAFAITLFASLRYLHAQDLAWDRVVQASSELGVLLTALTLVTGMVWGDAEWGLPWRWDDTKLVLVLVLFLVYVGHLFLRAQIPEADRRARVSAVYAIAGFAAVPLSWFAQRIWQSYHPTVFGAEGTDAGIETPGVLPLFLYALVVFIAIFAYLLRWRIRLLHIQSHIDDLSIGREVAP